MRRAGLYIRVSTEEQARIQDGSLVSQRKRLDDFVDGQNRKEAGWGQIVEVYCEEGKSAKDMNRPEFQRLLGDIQSGRINLVLATELSRLSRSVKDFSNLWDFFKNHKTKMITLREQFDTTTAAGEMMIFNIVNFNQFERMQTSERVSANFKSRAERGLWNGGTIPLGFTRNAQNPGCLLVDPKQAVTVKAIFKTFLKTRNLRETCLKLNEQGYRTKAYINQKSEARGGQHFTVQSLHHLLTNASFIGCREINKKRGDVRRAKASWPAIVEEKDFDEVQKVLESNRRKFKPNEWKTYPYPLTGITVCGECGMSLCGKSAHGKQRKHHYYDHPRTLKANGTGHIHKCQVQRVKAERFEDIVINSLKNILAEPGRIDEGIRLYRQSQSTDLPMIKNRLKAMVQSIKENEKRVENIVGRIAELPPEVSAAPIYKKLEALQKKILEESSLKANLEAELRKTERQDVRAIELKQRIERTIARLETSPKEKQREVFSNVIQFAEIHATKIRLGIFANDGKTELRQGSARGRATGAPGKNVYSILSGTRSENLVGSHTIKVGGEGYRSASS